MHKIPQKKIITYLILNVFLSYFFLAVVSYLGLSIDSDIAFATPDSHKYFEVGKWLYYATPTEHLTHRPFLFPFILFSSVNFWGIKEYFLLQFIFWLGSINFLFASLNKLFNSNKISIVGVLILASNLSFLMFTFHALTEVFVIFLITLFIYLLTCWINNTKKDNIMVLLLFVLVLLSVTKPVFFYFTIISSLIIIPILFYKYHYYKKIKKAIILLLLFIPLFFQIGIMKLHFNTLNVSTIGPITFKGYLFQRCYALENNITRERALQEIEPMAYSDLLPYVLAHKRSFIKAYALNLKENIKANSPVYLEYKKDKKTNSIVYEGQAAKYMQIVNSIYYYLHIIFFFIVIIFILKIFYKKEFNNVNIHFIILSLLCYSFIFSSAVSYDEGDRLVLPALPIWIVLYLIVLKKLFSKKAILISWIQF